MIRPEHIEKMRVEVRFPREGLYGAYAGIYMHRSVVDFFRTFTSEQIEKLQQDLCSEGAQYFGDSKKDQCKVKISKEHGLWSWDCPGQSCGFDPADTDPRRRGEEGEEWILFVPHNLDEARQLAYLLAVACYLRDIAEIELRESNPAQF
jgi:hypothetical protein